MKKLLLTSNGGFVTNNLNKIFPELRGNFSLAYITTAGKEVVDKDYMGYRKEAMVKLGWDYEEIDIEGKNEEELREVLKNKDIIYVEGGDTYYLLRAIKESGFDKVVKELLDRGAIYIGSSAGSYVACPTIEMAAWIDNNFDASILDDYTAMNLVPFIMIVHYEDYNEKIIKEKMVDFKYPIRVLRDDQTLLIKDDVVEFLGEGEEVKI